MNPNLAPKLNPYEVFLAEPNAVDIATKFAADHAKIVEILEKENLGKLLNNLVFVLRPKFEDGLPNNKESGFNGVPDLFDNLHYRAIKKDEKKKDLDDKIMNLACKKTLTKKDKIQLKGFHEQRDAIPILGDDQKFAENLATRWPRCGCCHERMQFVGQFDLLPFSLLHQQLGVKQQYHYSLSPFGQATFQHEGIYSNIWFQFFMCGRACEHFHNPNFDAHILITSPFGGRLEKLGGREKVDLQNQPKILADFMDEFNLHSTVLEPRKLTSLEAGFQFDYCNCNDFDLDENIENIEEKYPELFPYSSINLFGKPRSQQTERRYFSVYSNEGESNRMVPLLNFNSDHEDMTYQIYGDMRFSDGFDVFGKIDASCT